MSLTNPNKIVTEERLSDFYNRILPYLGGNDADSVPYDNTDSGLTSENVQDAIDELNESKASPLTNAEMTAIKNAFDATNTSKFATTYTKYSTEEQVVGEWIDGKPIYQKTIFMTLTSDGNWTKYIHGIANIESVVDVRCVVIDGTSNYTVGASGASQLMGYVSTIDVQVFSKNFANKQASVTFQYTKTTD